MTALILKSTSSAVNVPVTSMPVEVVASLEEPLWYRDAAPDAVKRAI